MILSIVTDAIEYWHGLLRPDVELTPQFAEQFTRELLAARLHFGDRIHCPFLRPFFLDSEQLALVTPRRRDHRADGRARGGLVALERTELLEAVALTDDERALVAIDPGYATASTASRLDSFILPDSLQFAEYNAESPAGLGYTEMLSGVFERLTFVAIPRPVRRARLHADGADARRAHGELPRLGRHGVAAHHRDRRLARGADLGRVRDPAGAVHRAGRRDHRLRPARPALRRHRLTADGQAIDLVYRRVLINDIVSRADDCRALTEAYAARAVCVANTFRCKMPHKKAFFAVLTDERFADMFSADEQAIARATCRGRAWLPRGTDAAAARTSTSCRTSVATATTW